MLGSHDVLKSSAFEGDGLAASLSTAPRSAGPFAGGVKVSVVAEERETDWQPL